MESHPSCPLHQAGLKPEINRSNIGEFRGMGGFSLISASDKIPRCAIMDRNQLAETKGRFRDSPNTHHPASGGMEQSLSTI